MECVTQLNSEVGGRVCHMESKMGEFATAHNELVDAYNEKDGKRTAIKAKLTDLEDRSRRNNIKLRGVSESISPPELRQNV